MKRIQSYSAPGITVTFDPNVCIHSAVCLRKGPHVFNVARRRWVRPEAATPEEVAEVVRRCPSGALHATLDVADARESAAPETDAPAAAVATIRASTNGPLLVEGPFHLEDENGTPLPHLGRVALCRCGGTGNPPFCDRTHLKIGFRPQRRIDPAD